MNEISACDTRGYITVCDTKGYITVCDTRGNITVCDTRGYITVCAEFHKLVFNIDIFYLLRIVILSIISDKVL